MSFYVKAGRSCKAVKLILESESRPVYDGYTIQPQDGLTLKVYCDMTRDGGGWTLIVSSHSNTWTSDNVRLRNEDKPNTMEDYSILKHGDALKRSYLISENTFQYRLEAQTMGGLHFYFIFQVLADSVIFMGFNFYFS